MQPQHTTAVALYARVSTEDQAERQTVQAQLDFLRKYCDLHQLPIAGEYVDDGISGATELDRRPEGRRLLDDAEAGRFGVVLVYRLDRLGRSLSALLAAHDMLEAAGVAIKSGTEPFDTTSPIGTFLFQLLGSLAQLERATITERMVMGRDRVAKNGKHTGGPIPLGYDVDTEGKFVPSARPVPELDITEAELVRDLFRRVADGTSIMAETKRLNALGVQPVKRYSRSKRHPEGTTLTVTDSFSPARLSFILSNPVYLGESRLASRNGALVRPAPALVDRATWDAVRASLSRNRKMSMKNAKRVYLLRGLMTCENCGMGFSGRTWMGPDGRQWHHYRCNSQVRNPSAAPCRAKLVSAEKLEAEVWKGCRDFILNPGEELADAQRQLRERLAQTTSIADQRRVLLAQILDKDTERERMLTMFRRGRISVDEADVQLDAVARETGTLRELLESLRAQEALTTAHEAHFTDTTAALARLREELPAIEATDDLTRKREIVELLVRRITIRTEGERRRKHALATVTYAYHKPSVHAVVSTTQGQT
jgi:site-specific DNA recombinase